MKPQNTTAVYRRLSELVTNHGVATKGGVSIKEDDLSIIKNAAIVVDSRRGITWMGLDRDLPKRLAYAKDVHEVSLPHHIITPALVDCHTHTVFAGARDNEFAMRLAGATYEEIANAGGGIVTSVQQTREATSNDLFNLALPRIESMISLGVGLLEIKSGYGLDWPTERKVLQVIRRLSRHFEGRAKIKSTFLGAHAFPPGLPKTAQARERYVRTILNQMLPAVAKERLADACDVFFDRGYFDWDQSERILTKARSLGLEIKLHADELANTKGAHLAAKLRTLSADHLLKADETGLKAMAKNGVTAVLLPTTALYLGIPYASMKKMRSAGVCVALATDFNPGSSPCLHLPFVMTLGCLQMGMTMPEAFAAATYGGARALGEHQDFGVLRLGIKSPVSAFKVDSYRELIGNVAHPGLSVDLTELSSGTRQVARK